MKGERGVVVVDLEILEIEGVESKEKMKIERILGFQIYY